MSLLNDSTAGHDDLHPSIHYEDIKQGIHKTVNICDQYFGSHGIFPE